MHAAIIAGGFGTRAVSMTADLIPKALLPVAGVPIIFRQMRVLRREGVMRLSVLAGHLGDRLEPALKSEAAELGLFLQVIVEPMPLGTAGCLTALAPSSCDTLILYGDMLFDLTLAPLQEFHRRRGATLTIVAHPNDHPRSSDLIVERDDLVQKILPHGSTRQHDYRNLVPAGLYLASAGFFASLEPNAKSDMIKDVLPRLVAAGAPIAVYNTPEYLRDTGSPARHALAERDLLAGRVRPLNQANLRPAIFFDCDGVLNEEPGNPGVVAPSDLKVIVGAGSAIRFARERDFLTVAITNRPQVAKGLVTFEGLDHILGRLEALLADDGGVLDRIYFCPHHPETGFQGEVAALKKRCECRKPGTLLLRQALADMPIDRVRSSLVGDSLRDIGAARAMGIRAYGVRTGYGCRDQKSYPREFGKPPIPDLMFETVLEAVKLGCGYRALAEPALAEIRRKLDKKPMLVGVSGRSRSGKSVLAHAIVRCLMEDGVACLHVRLDDWIIPASMREPGASAETRNSVNGLAALVLALRSGTTVRAPGYDAATRGAGEEITYDPAGQTVIVLEGSFAIHRSVRALLDLAVFVAVSPDLQRERFDGFYRWKGFEKRAIDVLWLERTADEWPAVDAQRGSADLILTLRENDS